MADNINIKDSSNAVVLVATEDIGGVEVQRVKLMLGAHGQDGGDLTDPNPLPVEIQKFKTPRTLTAPCGEIRGHSHRTRGSSPITIR